MKKMPIWILCLLLACLACNSSSEGGHNAMVEMSSPSSTAKEMAYDEMEMQEMDSSANTDRTTNAPKDRKIIKTAEIRMEVEDLKRSLAMVQEKLKKQKAYISQEEFNSSNYSMENSLIIRVPIEQFDALLQDLSDVALYVDYQRVSANDVTEEYLDIETRLRTKKEVRDRYIEILRKKARTVEEILMAEERIRVVQEEIESREGRLNYLKNQVSMSTIHLNIYQNVSRQEQSQPSFWKKFGRAIADGWDVFLDLILGLANIWPILLLGGFFLWGLRRFWRNR